MALHHASAEGEGHAPPIPSTRPARDGLLHYKGGAFTVKTDDRDVNQVCGVPIIAPITVLVREERLDREQRPKRHQPAAAPTPTASGVPSRFLALENVCYE